MRRMCSTCSGLPVGIFAIPITISHTRLGSSVMHSADVKVVPDGLFGLEYARDGQKLYRFFALEADRNTMPVKRSNLEQTSYLRKVLAYRQIITQDIHRSHLGLPNLLVLTVTTNEPPRAQRDATHLSSNLWRQIGRTLWPRTHVLLAARGPLRLIRHDAPLAARVRLEVTIYILLLYLL